MQWSRLKTRVKALLDPALSKRIDFHATSYRKSHDESENAWITVDSRQVFVASWYQHQRGKAEYKPQDFGDALRHYLDLKISDALIDPNPLIRALAIADRWAIRRSLRTLSHCASP